MVKVYERALTSLGSTNRVIEDQHYDRAQHRDHKAVEIEAVHAGFAKERHDPTADNGTDHAEHQIDHQSLASLVDDLAGNEARDESQDQPRQNAHCVLLVGLWFENGIRPWNLCHVIRPRDSAPSYP